jgi:hypothetical protein
MDKRYQVFVSSTFEDLIEARKEIIQALLELDCIPAGMELFPAADDDQWTLIKRVIDDCDYYLVVIGGRYGSIGTNGMSYTQMEYEYAVAQGKPVIAFLHKDPNSLPAKYTEKTTEGRQKLDEFRTLVQNKMCKYWITPADLGSVVSRSLIKLIKNNPAIGWAKADLLPDQSTAEEMLKLRKRIETLETELTETRSTTANNSQHLAQGEDSIELRFTLGVFKSNTVWAPDKSLDDIYATTWNQIFSLLSPFLIDEASDSVMKKELERFIVQETKSRYTNLDDKVGFKVVKIDRFNLNGDDFNTIKVQLLALRLMSKSSKKKTRSVNDKSAYWTLTPYGERIMTELRAIRRQ